MFRIKLPKVFVIDGMAEVVDKRTLSEIRQFNSIFVFFCSYIDG